MRQEVIKNLYDSIGQIVKAVITRSDFEISESEQPASSLDITLKKPTKKFKLHLEIMHGHNNISLPMGVYLSIEIPFLGTRGVLFEYVKDDSFLFRYSGADQQYRDANKGTEKAFGISDVYVESVRIINFFVKAYKTRFELVKTLMENDYVITAGNISFRTVTVPSDESEREVFAYYYSEPKRTFFLMDLWGDNTVSVTSSIESIAGKLYREKLASTGISPDQVKWVNIYGLNLDGIVFKEEVLEPVFDKKLLSKTFSGYESRGSKETRCDLDLVKHTWKHLIDQDSGYLRAHMVGLA